MLKKILIGAAVVGLAVVQLAGCGKQASGLDTTSVNQSTEGSVSSAAGDSIAISSAVNSPAGVGSLGLAVLGSTPSCPQVTKALIASNPATYAVSINFGSGCIPPAGSFAAVTTSGNVTMTVTLITNTTTGKVTQETIDANVAIVRTRWDGASLLISGTTDITKNLTWSGGSLSDVTSAVTVHEERIASTAVGRVVMHHVIDLGFTYDDTISGGVVTQRVVNGSGTVDHRLAQVTAAVTITGLTMVQGCCHPVDGSINIVLTRDSDGSLIGSYNLAYAGNGQCSDTALLDGHQITLDPCD